MTSELAVSIDEALSDLYNTFLRKHTKRMEQAMNLFDTPTTLTEADSLDERSKWVLVRRDNFKVMQGIILSAEVTIGVCALQTDEGMKTYNLGPYGFRIMPKGSAY